jgi:hypothetical protein
MSLRDFTTMVLAFLACAVAAYSGSRLILRRYQVAVLRSMTKLAGRTASTVTDARPASDVPGRPLRFAYTDSTTWRPVSRWALNGLRRTGLVYLVAGLAFAATMFFCTFRPAGWASYAGRFCILVWVFSWPAMLVWRVVTRVQWRWWVAGLAIYWAIGTCELWAYMTIFPNDPAQFSGSPAVAAFSFWAGFNWGMTIAVPIFTERHVRAIGVLMLATAVLASLGMLVSIRNQQTAVVVAATSLAAAIAWPMLQGVAALHQRRLITDQSLMVDSIWLLYGAMTAMFRWDRGLTYTVPAALLPFVVFKIAAYAGFVRLVRVKDPPRPLLLLRVFSLGDRSRQLFGALAMTWRYLGPIRLISGPDLAAETVEPNEFLDFVSRRLSRHFIDDADGLSRQIAALHAWPDFDGRYRVDELFCHDDTWEPAVRALIAQNPFVLMDLRRFSPSNSGCTFEVEELVRSAPLDRMVFVVDETTDDRFLRATFTDALARVDEASPNRTATDPCVRLFRLDSLKPRTIRSLAAAVSAQATG